MFKGKLNPRLLWDLNFLQFLCNDLTIVITPEGFSMKMIDTASTMVVQWKLSKWAIKDMTLDKPVQFVTIKELLKFFELVYRFVEEPEITLEITDDKLTIESNNQRKISMKIYSEDKTPTVELKDIPNTGWVELNTNKFYELVNDIKQVMSNTIELELVNKTLSIKNQKSEIFVPYESQTKIGRIMMLANGTIEKSTYDVSKILQVIVAISEGVKISAGKFTPLTVEYNKENVELKIVVSAVISDNM